MTTYRLESTELIHTPGVIRWAAQAGKDGRRALVAAFPTLPRAAIRKLLDGDYSTEGETVLVNIYDGKGTPSNG